MNHPADHSAAERRAEPVSASPSILRLSALERLAGAFVVIAVLWAAVYWAVT